MKKLFSNFVIKRGIFFRKISDNAETVEQFVLVYNDKYGAS